MAKTRVSRDIQVHDVTMVFHGRGESVIALEKANMHVPTGQFASIIGPSGCGKSTLLRLVADIMQPHSGQITLGGDTPRAARHDHALGFVFQSPTLLPWRTVRQNVELPLDVVGRQSARRSARSADELIDLTRSTFAALGQSNVGNLVADAAGLITRLVGQVRWRNSRSRRCKCRKLPKSSASST